MEQLTNDQLIRMVEYFAQTSEYSEYSEIGKRAKALLLTRLPPIGDVLVAGVAGVNEEYLKGLQHDAERLNWMQKKLDGSVDVCGKVFVFPKVRSIRGQIDEWGKKGESG